MKKFLMLLGMFLLITGCGGKNDENIPKEFMDNVNSSKSYSLSGSLEIINDEDSFTYALDVKYLKSDNYVVKLVNQVNNHEQIILKNTDGVYVVTPSLNKSFKFQSDWPNNGSQAYLLASIVNDIKKEDKLNVEKKDEYYIVKSKVSYPNNPNLTYQHVYLDDKGELKKVFVYDDDDIVKIKVVINNIDYKANLDSNEFKLEKYVKEDCCTESTTSNLEDILYPLYVPSDTYLSSKELIDTDAGTRAILTFSGAKDFVLVEEMSRPSSEFEVRPVYGDPLMLNDTVAALSGNSLYWTSNNVDYYLASGDLSSDELLTIASSVGNTLVTSK